jgi:hypothetical protein
LLLKISICFYFISISKCCCCGLLALKAVDKQDTTKCCQQSVCFTFTIFPHAEFGWPGVRLGFE